MNATDATHPVTLLKVFWMVIPTSYPEKKGSSRYVVLSSQGITKRDYVPLELSLEKG
jgi:hypothetical protein